ncbi:alpha/beta fold hydrolase [Streptomyces ipomoeae]|uniref:alpha/beta fold hydrolase n=1 Tax=Streptomyces ipomoeae TaxID=103232 RepID=UPI0011469806|nr:alpha/beta hydrolase [Streptomyces ipomoeae]MDX2939550.1 alpha/beta hydrolase [Streptomyces ipomoeae]TQE31017.1 alpha/beta hydrolase [Streptomyces ipomoeae]
MPHITTAHGTRLFYDTFGDTAHPPLVLLEGLGSQMIGWREEFCALLVEQGFRVVRLDNRDAGRSDRFDRNYALRDMAQDVAGLIDALGLGSAHIVGQSMGGMIAQELAIHWPDLVRSLTLFYTAPNPSFIKDAAGALDNAFAGPLSRQDRVRRFLESNALCASSSYPQDTAWLRALAEESVARDPYFGDTARQMTAIQESPDRLPALRELTVPVTVITGDADLLIDPAGSAAIAEAVGTADLHVFPGMGHEINQALWPQFVRLISDTAHRSGTHREA